MDCRKCQVAVPLEGIRFCPFCGERLDAAPEERRKAIVIFADISGFTALSQTLDPDVLRETVDLLMKRFSACIERHGGSIDKIIGDSIMFLFNVDRSFGDEPYRAVDTIEDLMTEVGTFSRERQLDLALHIGAAYGTVSVGAVGKTRTVMGDAVNLASRLLSEGKRSETLVSESFAQLFDSGVQFERLPPLSLKGIDTPVHPYRFLGKVASASAVPPFVGRMLEIAHLHETIGSALSSRERDSLLLVGPAGIGKSRIVAEFLNQLTVEACHTFRIYFDEGGTPFFAPFQTLIRKILSVLQSIPESTTLGPQEFWGVAVLDPVFWEQVTFDQVKNLLVQLLAHASREKPTLLVCEDLHRADASARELIQILVRDSSLRQLVVLATSHDVVGAFSRRVEIPPLDHETTRAFFGNLLPAPRDLTEWENSLLVACGGNPLFTLELASRIKAGYPADRLLGGRIDFLLSSALDELPMETLELVEQASLFGTKVSIAPLLPLSGLTREETFDRLLPTGFFSLVRGEDRLVFRSDLIRKAAYERINLTSRKRWHETIGRFLAGTNAPVEEVAHHFMESGASREAAEYALAAGRRLSMLPQQDTALDWFRRAELRARELKDAHLITNVVEALFEIETKGMDVRSSLATLDEREADPLLASYPQRLGRFSFMRSRFYFDRWMYAEAWKESERARAFLMDQSDDTFDILRGRILVRLGRHREAVRLGLHALASSNLRASAQGDWWSLLGFVAYSDRELHQAKDFYAKSLAACERDGDSRGIRKAKHNLGNVALARGHYGEAWANYHDACAAAIRVGDPMGYCAALLVLGQTNFAMLQFSGALANYQQAIDTLGWSYSESLYFKLSLFLGNALVYLGDTKKGGELLQSAREFFLQGNDPFHTVLANRSWCRFLRDRRRGGEALRALEEMTVPSETSKDQLHLLRLLQTELLVSEGRMENAQNLFRSISVVDSSMELSELILVEWHRVRSLVTERRDKAVQNELFQYLKKASALSIDFHRLPLLVEALEYGRSPETEVQIERMIMTISRAFPEEYRENFFKKPYVVRYYQLTSTAR